MQHRSLKDEMNKDIESKPNSRNPIFPNEFDSFRSIRALTSKGI